MGRLAAALALAAASVPAWAHAGLAGSEPPAGAVLRAAPASLHLRFTEVLEPAFSTLTLHDKGGGVVAIGKAGPDGADAKALTARLPHLAPGTYQVRWSVVGRDGHRTRGSFTFDVK
jgi:methionine-rich copper-binding protein CopC